MSPVCETGKVSRGRWNWRRGVFRPRLSRHVAPAVSWVTEVTEKVRPGAGRAEQPRAGADGNWSRGAPGGQDSAYSPSTPLTAPRGPLSAQSRLPVQVVLGDVHAPEATCLSGPGVGSGEAGVPWVVWSGHCDRQRGSFSGGCQWDFKTREGGYRGDDFSPFLK